MPSVGANQSIGSMTSVLHIAAMWQGFVHPKVAVCCVTIVWATIESTSSYQKWSNLLSSLEQFYSSQDAATLAFTERKAKQTQQWKRKRKKLSFTCSQTTALATFYWGLLRGKNR